ncbi:carbon-nitrogen hydrolase family protein [Methanothermobacter thermautotrophicus]|uniref:Carbon-nitrogen hydrolase family protein n=1 Tax=Methanothermobacter thermautotrophicus TaxID=145262 RepID=A0A842YNV3_METTF|nr:carbon-nitrogen hydrolase family protein [Methanothermobacter thermautotrophicus]MBE2900678.1 carbon-nitrogen hydrolase family protein [Methanothermobacter thermautotrophicus]MCQ8905753.1 carbon-nitrogen hydrolase family protein [Methanothermobacter sp.]HOQ18289.1 carbon-nitrogen hydrolase family protein [Methanothermobacter thermautotrophicus]
MRLGICQMMVTEDKGENVDTAVKMIVEASERGAQLIVLPEMFTCPYDVNLFQEYAEEEDGDSIRTLRSAARKLGVHLVAGSIPEKTAEGIYNTSFVIDDRGNIIGRHRKVHLFDIRMPGEITFRESESLIAGDSVTVIETPHGVLGVGICYDMRFPELSRMMALRGAEILIFPGAFNMTTGPAHWKLLVRSRALDNQCYCAAVSPARNPSASYVAYGHSMVADPWGSVVCDAGASPSVVTADIDMETVERIRRELPLLRNRRPDVYRWRFGALNDNCP